MKNAKIIASLLLTFLLLTGCDSITKTNSSGGSSNSTATVTHETTVVTTSGETIGVKVTTDGFIFAGYEGKPVLLEFYGDTCPHCMNAIPMYNNLQAKYGNKILILTVESYGKLNNAGLQAYAASKGMTYRTVAKGNSGNIKAYAEGLVGPMVGVPYLIVLNKNGEMVTSKFNDLDESWLEGVILDLI